jgi:hypothetical protein
MTSLRLLSCFLLVGAVASFVPNPTLKTTSALQMGLTGRADKEPARVKRLLGERPDPCDQKSNYIEVQGFRSVMKHAQACLYEKSSHGVILFRGGRTDDMEMRSFCHGNRTERKTKLRRLLKVTVLLQSYYKEGANRLKDGAEMFESREQDLIVATVRVMALLQQYSNLVENLVTPMLDTGKDLEVAASLACQTDIKESGLHRVVRVLLVPIPKLVDRLEKSRALWTEKNTRDAGRRIQRLGKSKTLLVELKGLLPVSAVRPNGRSGYVLVHEQDVNDFHELRKQHAKGEDSIDDLMKTKEAKSLIKGQDRALDYEDVMDLCIPDDVTFEDFFDEKSGEDRNYLPGFLKEQLYPAWDPMAAIITEVAKGL